MKPITRWFTTGFATAGPVLLLVAPLWGKTEDDLILKGKAAEIRVELDGGPLTHFSLVGHSINALSIDWTENIVRNGDTMRYPWRGHFLCCDQFGLVSENEHKNGMPMHGEASQVDWQVVNKPTLKHGAIRAAMKCTLPLARLRIERTLSLSENTPVLTVQETFINENKLGRIYNVGQHASIARPFLDESLLLNSNATRGFVDMPSPQVDRENIFSWPVIGYHGEAIDLSRQDNHTESVGAWFVYDNTKHGWITAANPKEGLLLGYLWDTVDYPWVFMMRMPVDGKAAYLNFEFSLGLGGPFKEIATKGRIFDRPLFGFLDAGEKATLSYTVFLSKIPHNYQGVARLEYDGRQILLEEKNSQRKITINQR